MKNIENANTNPELENIPVQEEDSSTVATTETTIENNLPTESNQTEEVKQTEELPPSLPDPREELIQDQPIEKPEKLPVQGEVDIPVESSAVEPIENAGALPEGVTPVEDAEILTEEHPDVHLEEHEDEISEEAAAHIELDVQEDYNLQTREELIGLLEKAVGEPDINLSKTRVALIRMAFLKKKKEENLQKYEKLTTEGGSKEEPEADTDELDVRFNDIFTIYKANKARYTEEQEKIKQGNLKKKNMILDELKQLISSEETLKKTYDEFKTLQDRWKEIGMVPRGEINNLWQNYHFLVEKFFEKVKLNKELKDLDLKKNLEAKMSLCEKTEELLIESSILRSFKKLQKYHEEWKELGPVPIDKKDEIWERFKNATDRINERRREHYTKIEEDQQKNLETKMALCEQAEEVMGSINETIKEWQDNTNKVNELLKIWKSIGTVPQKFNNEVWTRFKTNLDGFFTNKKEFFDKLKEQQLHNYNLKVELCMQAESLKTNTDWKKTTNDLIHLQNEWKKIGPVPKKHSDKIWKRFRAACDEFFQAKSSYFSNIQSHEEENLNKKIDLMKRIREFEFGSDKNINLDVLKNFQREWTEIGHIPIREKDRLHNEFRALINEHLDRLKISEVEISTLNYQSKFENMKNDPQARRLIGREKELLSGKITKMREDINLWENNIGFLAKSKNAALLREEFEKKIDKAKSELKVMEAKLKILKQQITN